MHDNKNGATTTSLTVHCGEEDTGDVDRHEWGPGMWAFLESKMQWSEYWTQEKSSRQTFYIRLLMRVLPCETCRLNMHAFIYSTRYLYAFSGDIFGLRPPPHLNNAVSLGRWLWEFHNHVNHHLNKRQVSMDEARRTWCVPDARIMSSTVKWRILLARSTIIYCANGMYPAEDRCCHWHGITAINHVLQQQATTTTTTTPMGMMRLLSVRLSIAFICDAFIVCYFAVTDVTRLLELPQNSTTTSYIGYTRSELDVCSLYYLVANRDLIVIDVDFNHETVTQRDYFSYDVHKPPPLLRGRYHDPYISAGTRTCRVTYNSIFTINSNPIVTTQARNMHMLEEHFIPGVLLYIAGCFVFHPYTRATHTCKYAGALMFGTVDGDEYGSTTTTTDLRMLVSSMLTTV